MYLDISVFDTIFEVTSNFYLISEKKDVLTTELYISLTSLHLQIDLR